MPYRPTAYGRHRRTIVCCEKAVQSTKPQAQFNPRSCTKSTHSLQHSRGFIFYNKHVHHNRIEDVNFLSLSPRKGNQQDLHIQARTIQGDDEIWYRETLHTITPCVCDKERQLPFSVHGCVGYKVRLTIIPNRTCGTLCRRIATKILQFLQNNASANRIKAVCRPRRRVSLTVIPYRAR